MTSTVGEVVSWMSKIGKDSTCFSFLKEELFLLEGFGEATFCTCFSFRQEELFFLRGFREATLSGHITADITESMGNEKEETTVVVS